MRPNNSLFKKDKNLFVILAMGSFSIVAAIICFKFLDSTAEITNKFYSGGGAFAGFIISYLLLWRSYMKLEEKIPLKPYSVDDRPPLPPISKPSTYDPGYFDESNRLKIQGSFDTYIDEKAFSKAIELFNNRKELVALDIGCADGYVTKNRFDKFDNFKKVIGIDKDTEKIKEANRTIKESKYDFRDYDVEDSNFVNDILKFNDDSAYDLVFMSFTLHHLADPIIALSSIKNILKDDGILIVRGSDDGSKLCFPDDKNVMKTVMELTQESPGSSDRQNGRKLYYQLTKAGFHSITMLHKVLDTTGLDIETKKNLFLRSFSYRANYLKKQLDEGHIELRDNYNWMKDALNHLEKRFSHDEDFYYMEVVFVAIAKIQ